MNKYFKMSAVGAAVATMAGQASATLPLGLADAITAYQTDATTALGLIMGAGVIVWGLIKLKAKLGW